MKKSIDSKLFIGVIAIGIVDIILFIFSKRNDGKINQKLAKAVT